MLTLMCPSLSPFLFVFLVPLFSPRREKIGGGVGRDVVPTEEQKPHLLVSHSKGGWLSQYTLDLFRFIAN